MLKNVYIENENTELNEVRFTALNISSLERLGLIQVTYTSYIKSENSYRIYENSDIFRKLKDDNNNDSDFVDMMKGIAYLTELGKRLLEVCCP